MFLTGSVVFLVGILMVIFVVDSNDSAFIAWVFLGTGLMIVIAALVEYRRKRKSEQWLKRDD